MFTSSILCQFYLWIIEHKSDLYFGHFDRVFKSLKWYLVNFQFERIVRNNSFSDHYIQAINFNSIKKKLIFSWLPRYMCIPWRLCSMLNRKYHLQTSESISSSIITKKIRTTSSRSLVFGLWNKYWRWKQINILCFKEKKQLFFFKWYTD